MSATAAIVVIGAEVLSAKVVDENGPFLLAALRDRGIETRETRTIGDDVGVIGRTVRELASTHTYVFTTGGVGPTHDDVTVAGIAAAFDVDVVRDPTLIGLLEQYYKDKLLPPHLKMAEVPRGATVSVPGGLGFVPVIRMRNTYVLPGVPALVKRCWASLEAELARDTFFARVLYFNVPESKIAELMTATQKAYPAVAIGSYPRFDDAPYLVKVTFDGRVEAEVDAAQARLLAGIEAGWLVQLTPVAAI
ncbi:MAG: competence/damage-inducible protein A [Myxococcota bacterium]